MNDSEQRCYHSSGWTHLYEGEEWRSMSLQDVPSGVPSVHCKHCGEKWFRNEDDDGWHQKYWTAEEIAGIKEKAKELTEFFRMDDDS